MVGVWGARSRQDRSVDTKGAQELARRLEARNGSLPEPEPPAPLKSENAAPIFHWFGIEPTGTASGEPSRPDESGTDTPAA